MMSVSKFTRLLYVLMSLGAIGSIVLAALRFLPEPMAAARPETSVKKQLLSSQPADKNFYETADVFARRQPAPVYPNVVGGITPHHLLAADLIARFFDSLRGQKIHTVVLLSPNHLLAGNANIITSGLDWQTPYGVLKIDQAALLELGKLADAQSDDRVMANEHGVYGLTAFIKKDLPDAEFVPLVLSPRITPTAARQLGKILFQLSGKKKLLVIASVDFSHYHTGAVAQAHDKVSINAIENYDFAEIYGLDIDSPAAITALLAYAQSEKSDFHLLANSNSALLLDQPDIRETTSYVTGVFTH